MEFNGHFKLELGSQYHWNLQLESLQKKKGHLICDSIKKDFEKIKKNDFVYEKFIFIARELKR